MEHIARNDLAFSLSARMSRAVALISLSLSLSLSLSFSLSLSLSLYRST